MTTEMTIILTIAYIVFVAWGYSRKAQVNTAVNTDDDCGYINYFPDIEEEEEESLKAPLPLSTPMVSETDWSNLTDEEFVLALGEMEDQATSCLVTVPPDPWEQQVDEWLDINYGKPESEFNVVQLEYQLALPPATELPVIETDTESYGGWAHEKQFIELSAKSIRELKSIAKDIKLPKYSSLKKDELVMSIISWIDCLCGQQIVDWLYNHTIDIYGVSGEDCYTCVQMWGEDFVRAATKHDSFLKDTVKWAKDYAQYVD